jgi:hypothetical protein
MAASSPPPPPPAQDLTAVSPRPHHPLLAAAAAASLLAVLYLPRPLLQLLLSPAPLSSALLLLCLLRLGSPTPTAAALPRPPPPPQPEAAPPPPAKPASVFLEPEFASWAPKGRALEVIHEEFEAEWGPEEMGLPWTSDSDSDTDDGAAGLLGEYGMIEIELDEDNLIEIDISRCR